jgi:hypothetical protein
MYVFLDFQGHGTHFPGPISLETRRNGRYRPSMSISVSPVQNVGIKNIGIQKIKEYKRNVEAKLRIKKP